MMQQAQSSIRLILFAGVFVLITLLLILSPESLQGLLFFLIFSVGIIYGIAHSKIGSLGFLTRIRHFRIQYAGIVSRISMGIACIFALISAYYFYPPFEFPGEVGFRYAVVCFIAVGISLWLKPITFAPQDVESEEIEGSTKIHWRIILWGGMCLALLTQINVLVRYYDQYPIMRMLRSVSVHIQIVLLIVGTSFLIVGFLPIASFKWTSLRLKREDYALVTLLIMTFLVRIWNLEYDIHRSIDEFLVMRSVIEIDSLPIQLLTHQSSQPMTWVYPYFQWLTYNILESSYSSIRFINCILSTLTSVSVYFLAKLLFNRQIGLLSVAILIAYPIHLHFSRLGIHIFADNLIGITAFVLIIMGLKKGHQYYFAIAGILLGFTHYFVEAGRLFYTMFAICFLGWINLFARRDVSIQLPKAKNLLILFTYLLIVSSPVYLTWLGHQLPLAKRFGVSRIEDSQIEDNLLTIISNEEQAPINILSYPLRRYVHIEGSDWFYSSDFSFVLPLLVPFFLLGLGYSIRNLNKCNGSLLFWWLMGVAFMIGTLITERVSGSTPRYQVVHAITPIVISLGLYIVWQKLIDPLLKAHLGILGIRSAAIIAIGFICIYQIHDYFHIYDRDDYYNYLERRAGGDPEDAVMRAIELPSNTDVHLISGLTISRDQTGPVVVYWGRQQSDLMVNNVYTREFTEEYIESLDYSRNQAFFIEPDNQEIRDLILDFFPETLPQYSPFDIPQEVQMPLYFVPAQEAGFP